MNRTWLSLLTGVLLLFVLSACGGSGSPGGQEGSRAQSASDTEPGAAVSSLDKEYIGTPDSGGRLLRRLRGEPNSLNWILQTTTYEKYVCEYLYDSLAPYDIKGNHTPELAESWVLSEDYRVYTFHLRKDVYWHDGQPFTSDDVLFSIEKILDPKVPALNKRADYELLDRVEKEGPHIVKFYWREPFSPGLAAAGSLKPIPKHVYENGEFNSHPNNRAPIGTGPFKFVAWKTAESIELARNENYWREPARLDRVIFKILPDDSISFNSVMVGDIDETRLNTTQWTLQTDSDRFRENLRRLRFYEPGYNYLGWNNTRNWFRDPKVRRAMTMMLPRTEIIENIYRGLSEIATGPFFKDSWAYNPNVKPILFDLKKAAQLLDEAGWKDSDSDGIRDRNGMKFEFEFLISTSAVSEQIATILKERAERNGVRVNIRQLEFASFVKRVNEGDFDAYAMAWSLDIEPDPYSIWHSSQGPPVGSNHVSYANPEVDRLIERARKIFDRTERQRLYHRVHEIVHEDQPYTFVNYVPAKWAVHKRIQDVNVSEHGLGLYHHRPGAAFWWVPEPLQTEFQ